jgi:hypothetical protein
MALDCLVDAGGREEELEPDAATAWVAGGVAKLLAGRLLISRPRCSCMMKMEKISKKVK